MKLKKIIFSVFFVFLFTVSAAVPVSGFTAENGGYGYSYSRQCFYSKPYIFDICWDISNKTAKSLESKKIALSDKASQTVWYEDSLGEDMADKDVAAALADVLDRINEESPMSKPMVLAVKNVGKTSPEKLIKRYYKNGDIACCGAVYPYADSKTRSAYLKKAYDDGRTGYFSVFLDCLGDEAVTESYCAKAYEDGDTACFSICFDALEDMGNRDFAEKYAEKAYCDGEAAFFSIIADDMSDKELKAWYARACKDGKSSFKAICGCDDDDWDDWDDRYDDWDDWNDRDDDWDDWDDDDDDWDDDYYVYDENTGHGSYYHGHHGGHHGC